MKKIVVLLLCLVSTLSYAMSETTSSVKIRLTNATNTTLYFNGVSGLNPTNYISLSNDTLMPGKTITVTGSTSTSDDLVGIVHFIDDRGHSNMFIIIDYREYHEQLPTFAMDNSHIDSQLTSLTLNPDPNGHALGYSAASVELDPAS